MPQKGMRFSEVVKGLAGVSEGILFLRSMGCGFPGFVLWEGAGEGGIS